MNQINSLVLGSGGREHAIAWKLSHSSAISKVYLHPGNAGTLQAGFPSLGGLSADAGPDEVAAECKRLGISLVVIGPEALLAKGYGDVLRAAGLDVVGPGQLAARLETSKVFAKEFMVRAGIPTAPFVVLNNRDDLLRECDQKREYPFVLKVDGLAAGKGVVIACNRQEALDFGDRVWTQGEFGNKQAKIILEAFLKGRELSYLGFCDTRTFIPMASATDYKRVFDNDMGPNTGGMGCISPSPYMTSALKGKLDSITEKVLAQMQREKIDYRGVLYIGLIIAPSGDPYVLEFNARFGDPETQAILPRLEGDFAGTLLATARGRLKELSQIEWKSRASVYVVGAAQGYPVKVRTGDGIQGLDRMDADVFAFYSGVGQGTSGLVTAGGRVLGVGCLASSFAEARTKVYSNLSRISWPGMHYRKDIGQEYGT